MNVARCFVVVISFCILSPESPEYCIYSLGYFWCVPNMVLFLPRIYSVGFPGLYPLCSQYGCIALYNIFVYRYLCYVSALFLIYSILSWIWVLFMRRFIFLFIIDVFMLLLSHLYLYSLSYFSPMHLLYILGIVQWLHLMFQKLIFCIINFIEVSFNYIIIWFHISVSHFYIVFCMSLAMNWIYFSVLRHALGINYNPVIKMYFKYHNPDIIGDIVELLRSHFRVLVVPGLSSKEQNDRQRYCWVGMFSCL